MPRTRPPRRWSQASHRTLPSAVLVKSPDRIRDRRARAVLAAVDLWSPTLLDGPGPVSLARLLATVDWLRPVDRWTGGEPPVRSLVDHLIRDTRYELPPFLYGCLLSPGYQPTAGATLAFEVLRALGEGKPLREAPQIPRLTRSEYHRVWTTEAAPSVVAAVRRAQVAGSGGPPWLAESLSMTRIGATFQPDEARWSQAIAVLAKEAPLLRPEQVGPIIDYLAVQPPPSVPRSVTRLLRDQAAWHAQLAVPTWGRGGLSGPLPRSGFCGIVLSDPDQTWSVREIESGEALSAEGIALRHCVATYHGVILAGRSSIWSVRRGDVRSLTLEVWNADRAVVQIRGLANRRATPEELEVVERWARGEGLTVRDK